MLDLPSAYTDLETYTDDICRFIDSPFVRQITGGIHVNDALIHDAWENLPADWTEWWQCWPDHRFAQQHLIDSIDEETTSCKTAVSEIATRTEIECRQPESLGHWLSTLRALALPRVQRPSPTVVLPDVLLTRMKTKKTAEVATAVRLIHDMCAARGITRVVDMGSGQGHVSVTLAYLFPELRVLAIDGSASQIAGSQSSADALGISRGRLTHMLRWIDGSPDLARLIQDWAAGQDCMLVGLHACGRLSEHMIRYSTAIPCISALAVVGCCYNHIVPRSDDACPDGFPISAALRARGVTLSPTALMTGCQAPNNWARPDPAVGEAVTVFGRRRLWRAVLEKMLFDRNMRGSDKSAEVGQGRRPTASWGIRKTDMVDFPTYARRAMGSLQIALTDMPADAELRAYEERYKGCEGRIAILWTLSVLCCKVVESVIALDRYRFLKEQEDVDEVDVVPIFDARISPRNLIIIATMKRTTRC